MTREQEEAVARLRQIAARRDWRSQSTPMADLRLLLAALDEAEALVPPLWRVERPAAVRP